MTPRSRDEGRGGRRKQAEDELQPHFVIKCLVDSSERFQKIYSLSVVLFRESVLLRSSRVIQRGGFLSVGPSI